jgi:hypothetical protein
MRHAATSSAQNQPEHRALMSAERRRRPVGNSSAARLTGNELGRPETATLGAERLIEFLVMDVHRRIATELSLESRSGTERFARRRHLERH